MLELMLYMGLREVAGVTNTEIMIVKLRDGHWNMGSKDQDFPPTRKCKRVAHCYRKEISRTKI
jgi:hypothetical protein